MTGILKNFFDKPYDVYCDNGSWKTGFEDIGLDIGSVCVAEGNPRVTTIVIIFLSINFNMCSKNTVGLRNTTRQPPIKHFIPTEHLKISFKFNNIKLAIYYCHPSAH